MDTIFAPATAPGRSGICVVRISGPEAKAAAECFAGSLPASGRSLRKLRDDQGHVIDEALVLVFPEKSSFTGECVIELHCHGSPAVLQAVIRCLSARSGLRFAEPGEFTRRALENGRLDLAQVEGLADLIDAETEAQRRQAMRVLSGELGQAAEAWRRDLLRATALVEATIDFADEEVPVEVAPEVSELIDRVRRDLKREAQGVGIAERIRTGFEVAIVGRPNAGKSTLLNRLAGRDAAITSEIAGTTRDVIEVRMDLNGYPVTILDTAGVRDAAEGIEAIGIQRGLERARRSDLRVHLVDEAGESGVDVEQGDLVLRAKDDEGSFGEAGLSSMTGHGVDALVNQLGEHFAKTASEGGIAIRERHASAMRMAADHLGDAIERLDVIDEMPDIIAEELRYAVRALDRIVGRIGVEDVLGEIFSSFCIGK